MEEEERQFDFCEKVDLHALDFDTPLNSVVAIAGEHNFRGIVVSLGKIDQLVKEINRPIFGDKTIMPICALDYPFGASSLDVRNYSIVSAKEKGAKEVEIVAPYHLIVNKDFSALEQDMKGVSNVASKHGLALKYVLDQNSEFIDESVRTKITRILHGSNVKFISTSLGYFDKKISHADNVIRMRHIKSKIDCQTKIYISDCDVDSFASYVKAGTDVIGLDWNKAAYLVHEYENMVMKK